MYSAELTEAVRRHLGAQVVVFLLIFSTAAAPMAIAATPTSDSTGVLSVIRRALERRRTRLVDSQYTSAQDTEKLHGRVVDRRDERMKERGIEEEDLIDDESDRYTESVLRRRERQPNPDENLASSVEQRRREREAEQEKLLRERNEAALERRGLDMLRENQIEKEQENRLEERKQLRQERASLAGRRSQYDYLRKAMVRAVNHERAAKNLAPLVRNRDLEMAAQLHAEDMLIRDYFDHYSPEGLSHVDRIKNMGYANVDSATCNCTAFKAVIGENLAKGQRSVNWAINELMDSPSHKKNILSPYFREIGIGIADRIWVQNFGSIELTPR